MDRGRPDDPSPLVRDESTPGAVPRRGYARQGGVPIGSREPLPTRVEATPPLPASYGDALRAGLRELGLDLSPEVLGLIEGHVRLLLAWTPAINLTAIREPAAVARDHVVDSLAGVPWIASRPAGRLLDLGSGGGFPGLPLAAAIASLEVALVEPIAKKTRFLSTVIDATGLGGRVTAIAARAEELGRDPGHRGQWPIVTARAVASTADLVELAFPLLAPGGSLVAWKRGDLGDELSAGRRALAALGGGAIEVIDVRVAGLAGHRLVVATRGDGPVPDAYPRQPAARRRRPW
jgi:16S rRNA (guanine527-N7)-methyltransferase